MSWLVDVTAQGSGEADKERKQDPDADGGKDLGAVSRPLAVKDQVGCRSGVDPVADADEGDGDEGDDSW